MIRKSRYLAHIITKRESTSNAYDLLASSSSRCPLIFANPLAGLTAYIPLRYNRATKTAVANFIPLNGLQVTHIPAD